MTEGILGTSGIRTVGVIGLGQMGSGIVEVCARAGVPVTAIEVSAEAIEGGLMRVGTSLDRAVERGKLTVADRQDAWERITATTDYDALAAADLVIEAATENADAKLGIFARLDQVVASTGSILASNTSTIPLTRIAAATTRPERVVGMHFFNPAPVMPLVEITSALQSADGVVGRIRDFAEQRLGKQAIVSADRAGFVVNALFVPYLMAAVRMLEEGRATAEDIDTGMRLGLAHPMGPFALLDLVGLDVAAAAATTMAEEYGEGLYAPPPLLRRMVEAGRLGRKTGRGFYAYP